VDKKYISKIHKCFLHAKWTVTVGGNETVLDSTIAVLERNKIKVNEQVNLPYGFARTKQRVIFNNIPSRQNIDFSIGSILPLTMDHDDYPAVVMGVAVLGKWGGFAGRLMSTVREIEGLTYGIYAKTEGSYKAEHCQLSVMTFFAPDKALQGLTSTFREIKKIYSRGITADELEKFKTILRTQTKLVHDSLGGKVSKVHGYHVQGFSEDAIQTLEASLQSLNVQEVNVALKKYLDPTQLTVSCAGPIKSVQKELERFISSV
jgi:zinc protease